MSNLPPLNQQRHIFLWKFKEHTKVEHEKKFLPVGPEAKILKHSKVEKLRNSDLVGKFEVRAKSKITSEIKPPLILGKNGLTAFQVKALY